MSELVRGCLFSRLSFCMLQDVIEYVAGLDFRKNEDRDGDGPPYGLASLRGGTLFPGDVLYLPGACVLVEKSTKTENVGLRAFSTFVNSRFHTLHSFYRQVNSSILGQIIMTL